MAANIIDNGSFRDIAFHGKTEVILTQNYEELGGWVLYGPANHGVRFMSHGNSAVMPGLPQELQPQDVNFACLSANNNSGLIGHRTNRPLQAGQRVTVTWFAATNVHPTCSATAPSHTIQLAEQVEHLSGDTPVQGQLIQLRSIHRSEGWVKFQQTFTIVGATGFRHLSFKGDPHAGNCGVVISGIEAVIAEEHKDTITIDEAPAMTVAPGKRVGEIRAKVKKNGFPYAGAEVKFEIADDHHTGTYWVGGDRWYKKTTDESGVALISEGTIVAGNTAGEVVLKATVADYSREFLKIHISKAGIEPKPGAALSLKAISSTFHSGNLQNAPSQVRFSRPLVVQALDSRGQPAHSGNVAFEVIASADIRGYLSTNDSAAWSDVSQAANTKLDVAVQSAGRASVWLWGEYSGTESRGALTIRAQVKDQDPSAVSFTENVWRLSRSCKLEQFGDNQHIAYGATPKNLGVRMLDESNAPVPGEWLHWTIETTEALKFTQVPISDSFIWESTGSAWTRTGSDGRAASPKIETTGPHTNRDAYLRVVSQVAAEARFVLHLSETTIPTEAYHIEWEDNDPLPVHEQTERTFIVFNPQGRPVGNLQVDVSVGPSNNNAGITVDPAQVKTGTASGIDEGKAVVTLLATRAGTSELILKVAKATQKKVQLLAQEGAVRRHLRFTGPDHLELEPGVPSAVNPISVYIDPPDSGIKKIRFHIFPQQLIEAKVDDKWLYYGELEVHHDGRFYIEQLKVRQPEVDPGDATAYTIGFDVPNRKSIKPVAFNVTIAGTPKVDIHPEHTDSTRYVVDSDSEIGQDSELFALAYRLVNGKRIPARHLTLNLAITITEPLVSSPNEVVFSDSGTSTMKIHTDNDGKCLLPSIKIRNWQGSFQVSVNVGGAAPVGIWYFKAQAAKTAAVCEFNQDRGPRPRLKSMSVYEAEDPIDSVTVYSDTGKKNPVHSGSVTFSISETPNTARASFTNDRGVFPDGDPILSKSARIQSNGRANVPTVRATLAGEFAVTATVSSIITAQEKFDVH